MTKQNDQNRELKINETLELVDIDGVKKEFKVLGVNRVTYTVAHQGYDKKGKWFNIPRSLRKDNWKLTR